MTEGPLHHLSEDAARLDRTALRQRTDAGPLARLLDNAAYWRAFDVARFEPLLAHAPPPLGELGIGVLLGFGEAPDARLHRRALAAAGDALALPDDLAASVSRCLDLLGRAVDARDAALQLEQEGFRQTEPRGGVPAFALRASGTARIQLDGEDVIGPARVGLGTPVELKATDERGRPLPPPTIENDHGAPVWLRPADQGTRAVWCIPGRYRLQVPGRVGALTVWAG